MFKAHIGYFQSDMMTRLVVDLPKGYEFEAAQ